MSQFVEIARAKVNLTLRIVGRRSDGYHALASLVAFADGPADRLTFDGARQRGLSVSGPFGGAIVGVNLLERVLDLFADAVAAVGAHAPAFRLGHVHLERISPLRPASVADLRMQVRCCAPSVWLIRSWPGQSTGMHLRCVWVLMFRSVC